MILGFRLGTRRADMRSWITKAGAVVALVASALAITVGTARAAGRDPAAGAVQLTGSQLAADLLPAGNFPRGFGYNSSLAYDSGPQLETGQAKYHLGSISCKTLANHFETSGFGETAVATNSYSTLIDTNTATRFALFGQTVYQFASASAARSFWQGSRSVAARCPGLGSATVEGKGHVTVQIVHVHIRGTQAFQADVTGSVAKVGAVRLQALIVLRGPDLIVIDVIALGRPVPSSPSLHTLMTRLLARVP
jgi:hypothetical protein